jgi:hypothetical protein
MKHLLLASTIALLAAGTVSARTFPDLIFPNHQGGELSKSERIDVRKRVPNAMLDDLTMAQVQAIRDTLRSDDRNRGGNIRSILMR